jgi:REP-associated tyrosine transposase
MSLNMPEILHVFNRGVDKRQIFLDDQDRFRFIHDLYEFNDEERTNTIYHSFARSNDIECRKFTYKTDAVRRKLLVDIHAFTLMPNHYHLLLSPLVDRGIPRFMQKLNMGYSKYFNQKYERTGTLFEGRYKSVPIIEETHFIHIPYYIHCNPLDLAMPEWRERTLPDYGDALRFLQSYRWSSHLDYWGERNFPSVTNREFLSEFFGGTNAYREKIENWLKDMESIPDPYDLRH